VNAPLEAHQPPPQHTEPVRRPRGAALAKLGPYRSLGGAARRAGVALGLLTLLGACASRPRQPVNPAVSLPLYQGHDTELYDDSIEPAAFGMALDKVSFRGSALFRERTQHAALVARVRITTVTIGKIDDKSTYHLQFDVLEQPLAGEDAVRQMDIEVREGSRAYSLIHQLETRARNKTMIAMWKHFRQGEEDAVHFYAAPDDADTLAAVREDIALGALKQP
jgi:hypothetical protein